MLFQAFFIENDLEKINMYITFITKKNSTKFIKIVYFLLIFEEFLIKFNKKKRRKCSTAQSNNNS